MSWTAAVRITAIAAVFAAAPAIADNSQWDSQWDPFNSRWSGYYAETPLEECQTGTQGDLELRACLSRLLLEAESAYEVSIDVLDDLVRNRADAFVQAEEAEALRFARETWRSYIDFQCDFEGAMLGRSYSSSALQATSCRVSLLRQQTARLTELATQIDPNAGPTGPGEPCVGRFCAVETETFRDWTAQCRRAGLCGAYTTAGSQDSTNHRLDVVTRPAGGGYNVLFTSNQWPVNAARAIAVRVDGRNPVVFRPYSGYSADGEGVFVLSDATATAALIRDMRRGGRLTVQYVDMSGVDRLATFSLYGVMDSLAFIEARLRPTRY
ncbi:MAG: lysozyme inhibitor LprI family protein [Oceanicaulis sp.]